jgi:hypothetical protein
MQLNNPVDNCCIIGQHTRGKHCPTLQFASSNQPTSGANVSELASGPHPKCNNAHSVYTRNQWFSTVGLTDYWSPMLVTPTPLDSLIDQCHPLRPLFVPRPFETFLLDLPKKKLVRALGRCVYLVLSVAFRSPTNVSCNLHIYNIKQILTLCLELS